MANSHVYFLPGRGEGLGVGLGRLITETECSIGGREITSDFARLRFSEQLALIRSDVQPTLWDSKGLLVGRSYGAYLLLHTLADLEPFPGRILLVSPVLGASVAIDGFHGSRPPRAERLVRMADSGRFPVPRHMEIHTGALDNGCDPALAMRFASQVANTTLQIVAGAGHQLGEDYLRSLLRVFLVASERLGPDDAAER